MLIEVTRNVATYGGWRGVLNGLVSSTAAQGDVFSVSIIPPPFTGEPIEVYLPASALRRVKPSHSSGLP